MFGDPALISLKYYLEQNKKREYNDNIVILRSVYSKVGSNITINPCRDKKTGAFPSCVRKVDDRGNMILSESDKEKLSAE